MGYYIDQEYLLNISFRLTGFKKISDTTYNCRCPICGDSQKKLNKKRGYFFKRENKLFYKCHNCDASKTFYNFLEDFDPEVFKQYKMALFTESNNYVKPSVKDVDHYKKFKNQPPPFQEKTKTKSILSQVLDSLDMLDDNHPAVKYCLDRQMPRDRLSDIYYIDDMSRLESVHQRYKGKFKYKEPRIIFPAYSEDLKLSALICRDIGDNPLRYVNLKIREDSVYIFGLDRIDLNREIYILEGPIDSLFVDNGIAVGGTSFIKVFDIFSLNNVSMTFVLDNQPRNRELCQIYSKIIERGGKVVIWPQSISQKDVNEMLLSGMSKYDIMECIKDHTFSGPQATLKLAFWKKY